VRCAIAPALMQPKQTDYDLISDAPRRFRVLICFGARILFLSVRCVSALVFGFAFILVVASVRSLLWRFVLRVRFRVLCCGRLALRVRAMIRIFSRCALRVCVQLVRVGRKLSGVKGSKWWRYEENNGTTRRCTRPPTAPFAALRSQARYTSLTPLPAAGELVVSLLRAAWLKIRV
jgi:hypothetical protein